MHRWVGLRRRLTAWTSEPLDPHHGSIVSSNIVFKLGAAAVILGVFGLLLGSGLPDLALAAAGFAVAALAIGVGLRIRGDE